MGTGHTGLEQRRALINMLVWQCDNEDAKTGTTSKQGSGIRSQQNRMGSDAESRNGLEDLTAVYHAITQKERPFRPEKRDVLQLNYIGAGSQPLPPSKIPVPEVLLRKIQK